MIAIVVMIAVMILIITDVVVVMMNCSDHELEVKAIEGKDIPNKGRRTATIPKEGNND